MSLYLEVMRSVAKRHGTLCRTFGSPGRADEDACNAAPSWVQVSGTTNERTSFRGAATGNEQLFASLETKLTSTEAELSEIKKRDAEMANTLEHLVDHIQGVVDQLLRAHSVSPRRHTPRENGVCAQRRRSDSRDGARSRDAPR